MFYDTQDPALVRPNPELLSIRRLETLRRHGSLNRTVTLPPLSGSLRRPVKRVQTLPQQCEEAGLDNPAMDLYEQALQQETDSLDQVVVVHPDLFHADAPAAQEDADRAQQIDGLRRALGKVVSLAPRNSLKGKAPSLPNPTDFNQNWEGIESYIHKQLEDTEPQVFTQNRKPFYQRQWFAMTIYISLAISLIALIIGIACFIAIVIPSTIIKGQIIPTTTPFPRTHAPVPAQDALVQDATPTTVDSTSSIAMDSTTPAQVDLDSTSTTTEAATTVSPVPTSTLMSSTEVQPTTATEGSEETTTSGLFFAPVDAHQDAPTTPAPLVPTTAASQALGGNWMYLLTLPGPLQGLGHATTNTL